MNKKLLIGLSSMALVAGFWACGEGSVEVIEEQSDDEMIRALLATDNMKFGASDIKKAKDACMNDFECFNEMTKAQGAAIVESSSEEALSSATPVSSTVASSSSDGGFKFSSIGPIGDLSSSSEVAPPPQSSSSEDKPLTGLGDCGPSTETVELNTPTTWKFTMGPSFGGISAITSAQFEWTFEGEGATPATSTVARSVTSGQVTYSKSGKKTATVKVSLGSTGSETIQCSKTLQVNGVPITGCKCLGDNIEPDVSKGESASWILSGCTSTGANIISYTWTGATADATGLAATAAVTAKGDEVKNVSVAVANDDSTVVTVTCPDAKAIDMTKPDYELKFSGNQIPQTGIEVQNEGCVVVSGTWTAEGYNPKLSVVCSVDCADTDDKKCYQTTNAVSISVGSGSAVSGQYSASASSLITNSLSGSIEGKSVCVKFSGMVKDDIATCKLSTN